MMLLFVLNVSGPAFVCHESHFTLWRGGVGRVLWWISRGDESCACEISCQMQGNAPEVRFGALLCSAVINSSFRCSVFVFRRLSVT